MSQRKYVITEEDHARVAWDGSYKMAKNEFRLENYIGLSKGQEAIRCWFRPRMRSGTAGLFADKKRCRLCGRTNLCYVIGRK